MKKRKIKKLTLNKRTVHSLDDKNMQDAVGATGVRNSCGSGPCTLCTSGCTVCCR
jgi:hypothetical protein